MIGIMLEHDFMIKKRICDTFVLTKRGFPGSGQMLLNTLLRLLPFFLSFGALSDHSELPKSLSDDTHQSGE